MYTSRSSCTADRRWLRCSLQTRTHMSTTEATKSVWKAFENYVTVWLVCFYCVVLLVYIGLLSVRSLCLSYCLVWRINVFICAHLSQVSWHHLTKTFCKLPTCLRWFSQSCSGPAARHTLQRPKSLPAWAIKLGMWRHLANAIE